MPVRKVFLKRKEKILAPFGDHVRESFINQKTLAQWQAIAAAELGHHATYVQGRDEIKREEYPCLIIDEDLFFNANTLREFIRVSEQQPASTRLTVKGGTTYFRQVAPFQEGEDGDRVSFGVYYLKRPDDEVDRDVLIDMGEYNVPIPIPANMRGAHEPVLPQVLRPIMQIRHPIHLVWVNVVAVNVRFAEVQRSLAARLALALKSRSLDPSRLLARMNKIGKGCSIHPTACLEGAEIGDNVRIGAHSVVRMSSIGDGCDIGDGAVIRHSVLGPKTVTFDDLNFNFAVTYPEAFLIHGPYNLSVFGRASSMFATILTDYRLDGKPIRVEIDGKLLPCPFPFVGSFIGHRTRVAGGSIIAPGRLIPNDLLIFPSAASTLTRIDPDLPKNVPLAIERGGLEPVLRDKSSSIPEKIPLAS